MERPVWHSVSCKISEEAVLNSLGIGFITPTCCCYFIFVHRQEIPCQTILQLTFSCVFSMSDRSAEDLACSCSHFQSQDRLHQHPCRCAAGGDAVSETLPSPVQHFVLNKKKNCKISQLYFLCEVVKKYWHLPVRCQS